MADILVESFDVDISNASTHTLTNDVGATSKAFIHRPGPSDKCSGGPTGSTGNAGPSTAHAGMALTATDTITFYAGSSTTQKVIGEVWRYVGSAGGANEFIKRGSYALTLSGTTASTAVSGISNRNKCIPFITGISSSSSSVSDYDSASVYAYLNSSGNLVVGRNNSTVTVTVYVDVVEFTGSNWSIGHGKSSSHDGSDETVTLNMDSTGAGGSTFDVGDWSTAFLEVNMGGDSTETGLSDVLVTVYPAASTTQAVFCFIGDGDATAKNDSDGYIHVAQNDDLIVNYGAITNLSEGNGTYGTASFPAGTNTGRNIDELALTFWADTTGTGTAHARGRMQARITDETGTIQHWIHRSGNDIDVHYSVIDLSQLVSATSDDLTADDLSVSISIASAAIGQKHILTGSALTAAVDIADAVIGQIHGFATTDISLSVSVDSVAIAQIHGLTADDLAAGISVDSPLLSSGDVLIVSPPASYTRHTREAIMKYRYIMRMQTEGQCE